MMVRVWKRLYLFGHERVYISLRWSYKNGGWISVGIQVPLRLFWRPRYAEHENAFVQFGPLFASWWLRK